MRFTGFSIVFLSVASLFSCLSTEDSVRAAKVPLQGRIVRNFGIYADGVPIDPTGCLSVQCPLDAEGARKSWLRLGLRPSRSLRLRPSVPTVYNYLDISMKNPGA